MAVTAQQQAIRYYARRRRRGLLDPASALYRTHVFTIDDTEIDTAAAFGDARTRPVVFAFALQQGENAAGLVFEFGSEDRGVAIWVDGADMGVAAGAAGDDGVTLEVEDALPAGLHRFVLSIEPGSGRVDLYRNGQRIGGAVAVNETFDGGWADDDDGAAGDVAGTASDRVPVGSQIPLEGAALVGALSAFVGQRVRI